MDVGGGLAVNLPLRVGDALEYGDAASLHPLRELAARDQFLDVGEIPAVLVFVAVAGMAVAMVMIVPMVVVVAMLMLVFMAVAVLLMRMVCRVALVIEVDIELRPGHRATLLARSVQVVDLEPKFFQLVLQGVQVDTQVEHRAQEHVAADAAEQVEVEGFHTVLPPLHRAVSLRSVRSFAACKSPGTGERVDLAGGVTGAKPIVDVHHRQAASATAEHPEERVQTA